MNDYIELRLDLEPCSQDATDVLAALLAEVGYECFVPDERGLTAYVRSVQYDDSVVDDVIESLPF